MELLYSIYRWLFAYSFFRRFNYALFRLSLSGLGILNYKNDRISGEYYLVKSILSKHLNKPSLVMFDVGANIGNYSNLLLRSFTTATIYAFEPHPYNYSRLTNNVFSPNVFFHNIALGDSIGKLILYDDKITNGTEHASIYKEVISEIHGLDISCYEVTIDTLDNFAKVNGVDFIDYLKIDTEGNDLSVLKGGASLIKNEKIGFIHFEFNEMNVVSRVFFRDFRTILSNYNLFRLLPNGLLPLNNHILTTEIFAYQNILAVPKKWQIVQ